MSKNLTMIEINELELDQLHSDLDYAGGKIRELEERLEVATDALKSCRASHSFDCYPELYKCECTVRKAIRALHRIEVFD